MSPSRRDFFAILAGAAASLATSPTIATADRDRSTLDPFCLSSAHPSVSYINNAGDRIARNRSLVIHRDIDGIWSVDIGNLDEDGPPLFWTSIYINDPSVIRFLDALAEMVVDPPGSHRSYPHGSGLPAPYSDWYSDASMSS